MSSPCVQGALCVTGSADGQGRCIFCGGSRQRRNGWRQRFLRGKDLLSHLRGLESIASVVTEARERAIWERSDLATNVGNPLAAIVFIAGLISTTCQRQLRYRCGITNLDL